MNWFFLALRKYADFSGRARRMEYWCFQLCYYLIYFALYFLDRHLGTDDPKDLFTGALTVYYSLALLIPTLSVGARRLHDIGKSGWWQLLFLTGIGALVLLVFFVREGDSGPNKYGPDPKAGALSEEFH